ncbi:MAG: GreA/GreB family elongation factor [Rariglobus sp.]
MNTKPIYISQTDQRLIRQRLPYFIESKRSREAALQLQAELDRAIMVADDTLSPDIVALGCHVELHDLESGERDHYTLTLPENADADGHRISVFSPLGTALLGYANRDEFEWKMPGGLRRFRIAAVSRPGVTTPPSLNPIIASA